MPPQDDLPPMPPSLVARVVERELLGGAPLKSRFSAFDPAPLGSASVAQVITLLVTPSLLIQYLFSLPLCFSDRGAARPWALRCQHSSRTVLAQLNLW